MEAQTQSLNPFMNQVYFYVDGRHIVQAVNLVLIPL